MSDVVVLGAARVPVAGGFCPLDVCLDRSQPERPIGLGQGGGHGAIGWMATLQELRDPSLADHLALCGCGWLVDLAEREAASGRVFTPAEILDARPRVPESLA